MRRNKNPTEQFPVRVWCKVYNNGDCSSHTRLLSYWPRIIALSLDGDFFLLLLAGGGRGLFINVGMCLSDIIRADQTGYRGSHHYIIHHPRTTSNTKHFTLAKSFLQNNKNNSWLSKGLYTVGTTLHTGEPSSNSPVGLLLIAPPLITSDYPAGGAVSPDSCWPPLLLHNEVMQSEN